MADKSLTIPTPIATTPGISIILKRTPTGIEAFVGYDPGPGLPQQFTWYNEALVAGAPAAIRDAIDTLFTRIVPNAANRMGF